MSELVDRIYDVLDFTDEEEVVDFELQGDTLVVNYIDEDGIPSRYLANMTGRDDALDYVCGLTNTY